MGPEFMRLCRVDAEEFAALRKPSWIWRGCMFLARFALASQNMGIWGAYKVFIASRWNRSLQSVHIRGIGEFWFRGGMDFGVMSHFYNLGYRIVDTPGRPITRIIDGGANIGVESRRFAHFHPNAHVIAVEPELKNFDMLSRNLSPPHVAVRAALWPRPAKLALEFGDTPEGCRVYEDPRANCEAVTIPQICDEAGWDEIDILKLDIEGAEYELFSNGCEGWIGRVNCFIFECPDPARPTTTARIFAKLPSADYRTEICGECLVVMKADLPWKLEPQALL
jgi:FkbM family methyltransferase